MKIAKNTEEIALQSPPSKYVRTKYISALSYSKYHICIILCDSVKQTPRSVYPQNFDKSGTTV